MDVNLCLATMINPTTGDGPVTEVLAEVTSPTAPEELTTRKGAYGEESGQDDVVTQNNLSDDSIDLNNYTTQKSANDKHAHTERHFSSTIPEQLTERSIDGCDNEKLVLKEETTAIDYSFLDWNKVFHFLANLLDATKSILFFNTLYGNTSNRGELNSSTKYKQVENDTKLRLGIFDTITLLVEQFKAWKEYAGKNAKLAVISRSLQELNLNETFDKFHNFMRFPPMLSPMCQEDLSHRENFHWSSDQKHDIIPFSKDTSPQVHLKTCVYTIEQRSYCQKTRKAPDGVQDNVELLKWCNQAPIHQNKMFPKSQLETETSHQSQEDDPLHKATGSNSGSLSQTYLSMASFRLLVKEFVTTSNEYLLPDMYQILLRDTITKVMKETDKSAEIVLSLSYQNFLDADKVKTKRETIVVMYSKEVRLVFGESAFSDLSFYAEHARQQVVDRFGENNSEEDAGYLFLDFTGKRMNSKILTNEQTVETDECRVYVRDTTTMEED